MLNGKFYTGLPPKMIDRNGTVRNRMESHFFWPDDTQAVSAVETRVRRRNSFQMEPSTSTVDSRQLLQRKSSLDGESGVDTKKMFHKEFAKSSIQFYDNIPEVEERASRAAARRQVTARRPLRQEIAAKPTATKLELPDRVNDQIDTTAKKKQTFNSKIEFYDYVDDDASRLNNRSAQAPKMDMNNKREVERNSKNSPKLQVRNLLKGSVRNDFVRDEFTPERNDFESSRTPAQHIIHNIVQDDEHPHYQKDSRVITKRNYGDERDTERTQRSKRVNGLDVGGRYNRTGGDETPKRILKNTPTDARMHTEFEDYGAIQDHADMGYVEQSMRRMRVSSPKKHVTYRDDLEAGNYVEREEHFEGGSSSSSSISRQQASHSSINSSSNSAGSKQPNMKAGNNQRQQQGRVNTPDYDQFIHANEVEAEPPYMEAGGSDTGSGNRPIKKSFNNSLSNNSKQFGNRSRSPARLRKSPSQTRAAGMRADDDADGGGDAGATTGTQKHLRSNICFFDGAIVADNERTPTSSAPARRKARSSATQRVSVGLPY